jgi:putative resolvase
MNDMVSISKACKMLGISQQTLRAMDESGELPHVRTQGGHRRYLISGIQKVQGLEATVIAGAETPKVCCYCRVSSHDQKQHGDLERQKLRVLEYCAEKKYTVEHILVETCSGMKAHRPKLDKLYGLVRSRAINKVVVEHKDRLTRFMFDVFKEFFDSHGVTLECVEQDLPKSFEAEMVADIMSLLTSFSATLHSRRKKQSKDYRKRMEQEGVFA